MEKNSPFTRQGRQLRESFPT